MVAKNAQVSRLCAWAFTPPPRPSSPCHRLCRIFTCIEGIRTIDLFFLDDRMVSLFGSFLRSSLPLGLMTPSFSEARFASFFPSRYNPKVREGPPLNSFARRQIAERMPEAVGGKLRFRRILFIRPCLIGCEFFLVQMIRLFLRFGSAQ